MKLWNKLDQGRQEILVGCSLILLVLGIIAAINGGILKFLLLVVLLAATAIAIWIAALIVKKITEWLNRNDKESD